MASVMHGLGRHVQAAAIAGLRNKRMAKKLLEGRAIDVSVAGREVEPGLFALPGFEDGVDYCDTKHEAWIWSIGRRRTDGGIFAATDTRFYLNPQFECLWLR